MSIRQIEDLPIELQKLYFEFKTEDDAIQGSKYDYVETTKNVLDNSENLDCLEEPDDIEYDENDENTYDMNLLSPSFRDVFNL